MDLVKPSVARETIRNRTKAYSKVRETWELPSSPMLTLHSYANLLTTHFEESVLKALPENQRSLDEQIQFMPSMSLSLPCVFQRPLSNPLPSHPSGYDETGFRTRSQGLPTRVSSRVSSIRVTLFYSSHIVSFAPIAAARSWKCGKVRYH